MRLNYKTYPIWKFIENPNQIITGMEIDEGIIHKFNNNSQKLIEYLDGMRDVIKQMKENFYISTPFQMALVKALPRLEKENYRELDPKAAAGAFIVNGGVTVYLANPGDTSLKLAIYGFTRTANTCFAILTKEGHIGGSYPVRNEQGVLEERVDLMANWIDSVLALLYFIKNVDIETKILKPGQKDRSKGKHSEKHFNESNTNVTLIDCAWFTELIAINGHKVSGHLRKQPFGSKSNPKYRWIWIDEYQKGEYKRRARKEIYEEGKSDN
jgi:hypothetical protein